MGKIYVRYEIDNPKSIYKPLDEISGTFWIKNRGEKEKKLKKVEIRLVEWYYIVNLEVKKYFWVPRRNFLNTYPIDKGNPLKVGETMTFNFKIQLPKKWKPRNKHNVKDWHLVLGFFQKTGLAATVGADHETGNFVLPIEGSPCSMKFDGSFKRHPAFRMKKVGWVK